MPNSLWPILSCPLTRECGNIRRSPRARCANGKRSKMKIKLGLVALLTFCFMSAPVSASKLSEKLIDDAKEACVTGEKGKFDQGRNAITTIDLNGDKTVEEIIDSSKFTCSTTKTLYCATGGCPITVIVNDKPTEFLAHKWRVIDWDGQKILLLSIHHSACGDDNGACFSAFVLTDKGFRSVADK